MRTCNNMIIKYYVFRSYVSDLCYLYQILVFVLIILSEVSDI